MSARPSDIIRMCRYDPAIGTYPIGAAVALAHIGLRVAFFSDPDLNPSPLERLLYEEAAELGVAVENAIPLSELDDRLGDAGAAIVLYEVNAETMTTHLTPVLGVYEGEVVAPNEGDGISVGEFEQRRSAAGILRQCILVWPLEP